MQPSLIAGGILVLIGTALILARRRLPRLIHSGLKRFHGEPFADMVFQRTAPGLIVLVGIVTVLLGLFNILDVLWLRD